MSLVEKDLEDLGALNWREIVQDRDKLSDLVMAAIIRHLESYEIHKKKKNMRLVTILTTIILTTRFQY
jgi:hypothetical protein